MEKTIIKKKKSESGAKRRLSLGGTDAQSEETSSTPRGVNEGASTSVRGRSITPVGDFTRRKQKNLTPRKINIQLLMLEKDDDQDDISFDESESEYDPSERDT